MFHRWNTSQMRHLQNNRNIIKLETCFVRLSNELSCFMVIFKFLGWFEVRLLRRRKSIFWIFLHFGSTTLHPHDFEWPSVGAHKSTHPSTLKLTKTNIVMISLFKNGRYRLTLHILTQRIITAQAVGPEFSLRKCLSLLQIYMKPCQNMFFARAFYMPVLEGYGSFSRMVYRMRDMGTPPKIQGNIRVKPVWSCSTMHL